VIPLHTLARLFLRLGLTAFGGPAAHIAMLHYEVVRRRMWMSDEEFAELIAITNLIPGPNSTEMALHVGRRMAGWPGFFVAGLSFILPAALMVTALAMMYVQYGRTPDVRAVMNGVVPVIIAVIAHATIALGRSQLTDVAGWMTAAAAAALAIAGVDELLLLVLAGLVAILPTRTPGWGLMLVSIPTLSAQAAAQSATAVSLSSLLLFFLKIGSVLFGSGYVLIAFLRADLVERLGWLTDQQLLDAVAVGQITPGPLFTTATFIGYLLRGAEGALAATVGIFLPAFVFVALTQWLLPFLRRSAIATRFLSGVIAASIGLMAGVAATLTRSSLTGALPIAGTLLALIVLLRWKVNSAWLVVGAGVLAWAGATFRASFGW